MKNKRCSSKVTTWYRNVKEEYGNTLFGNNWKQLNKSMQAYGFMKQTSMQTSLQNSQKLPVVAVRGVIAHFVIYGQSSYLR